MWFPNRSDTNRPVQAQKQARSLKFWIYKVEELYYPCSENKGADQLRSYCEADLRLCFRICRLLVFPCGGSYSVTPGQHVLILLTTHFYISRLMGKSTICIGENKDADQLRGNREADQRLCFRYSDSTIPPLLKSEISSI